MECQSSPFHGGPKRADINWTALKRSLDRVTCIRREHPQCSFHYTEAQAFSYLSREIAFGKETVSNLTEWITLVKRSTAPCELHYIHGCYECSKLRHLNDLLSKSRKRLASLKFQLMSLPTVAAAMGRTANNAVAEVPLGLQANPVESVKLEAPIAKLYGRERTGNETSRQRRSDIDDNIRLVEAWLKARAA
jgi:hypothetical protein